MRLSSFLLIFVFLSTSFPVQADPLFKDGFCSRFLKGIFSNQSSLSEESQLFKKVEKVYQQSLKKDGIFGVSEGEKQLAARWIRNDQHAKTLERLGAKVKVFKNGSVSFHYPDLKTFVESYQREMRQYVESGRIQEKDILWPAVAYRNVQTGEIQFFKLLEEKGPLSSNWKMVDGGTAISHNEWAKAYSEGKIPFDPSFYEHDFSHMTEYVNDPEKMVEMKRYYTRIAKGELRANEEVGLSFSRLSPEDDPSKKLYYRLTTVDEAYSLPDLKQSDQIKKRLKLLFSESIPDESLRGIQTHLIELAKKDPNQVVLRAKQMLEEVDQSLLRLGGVSRDTEHLHQLGYSYLDFHYDQLKTRSFSKVRPYPELVRFKEAVRESGHVHVEALRKVYAFSQNSGRIKNFAQHLKLTHAETQERVIEYLGYELAHLEALYKSALRYEMTPAKLAHEALIQTPKVSSDTYQFFDRATEEGSILHWAFVSQK